MFGVLTSSAAGGCRKHRFTIGLFVATTFVCYLFVSAVDVFWTNSVHPQKKPVAHSVIALNKEPRFINRKKENGEGIDWEKEYNERLERVRTICEKDEVAMMRRVWRVAANRRFGKDTFCKTKMCPIIVDEKKVLFFCFIPKVASTKVKEFFLNANGISVDETLRSNDTALHVLANEKLRRVSPMYYPATTARRFYKIIFVRHPFDRLVSAFRSKVEAPRQEVEYFYRTYWDKIIQKLRPVFTNSTSITQFPSEENYSKQLTFREFVWYLTHSLERDFDDHWAPYWSRCDPCLVDYDFVGKLETSEHDFPYAFHKVGIDSPPNYWTLGGNTSSKRALTLKYFASVPEKEIRDLYKVYRLDFELFGYTLDGFVN